MEVSGVCTFNGEEFFSNYKVGKKYQFTILSKKKIKVGSEVMSHDSFCIQFQLKEDVIIKCGLYTRFYVSEFKEMFGKY